LFSKLRQIKTFVLRLKLFIVNYFSNLLFFQKVAISALERFWQDFFQKTIPRLSKLSFFDP